MKKNKENFRWEKTAKFFLLNFQGRIDDDEDDDPSYNTDAEDEQEEEEEEEDPLDLKNHFNEIERQRSIQDNQAEEVHLDEDLEHIGQNSSMFKKGLELKQRKNPSKHKRIHNEMFDLEFVFLFYRKAKSEPMKNNASKTVTLSSVLLAQRFSSTLLATSNKNNVVLPHNSTTDAAEKQITNKKQLNPRRHVFGPNENLNPTAPSGEKVFSGKFLFLNAKTRNREHHAHLFSIDSTILRMEIESRSINSSRSSRQVIGNFCSVKEKSRKVSLFCSNVKIRFSFEETHSVREF